MTRGNSEYDDVSRVVGSDLDSADAVRLPRDVSRFSDLIIDGSDAAIASAMKMLSGMRPLDVARLVVDSLTHPDRTLGPEDLGPLEERLGLNRG